MTEKPGYSSEFPIGSSTYTGPLVELETIARTWVDVAFKIDLRDIRLMNRLVHQQMRLESGSGKGRVSEDVAVPAGVFAFATAAER